MTSRNQCSWSPCGACCGYPVRLWLVVEQLLWALEAKAASGPVKPAKGLSAVCSAHPFLGEIC